MAKFTPGALAGRISGSVHSQVFSRNRYGAYIRARSVPTNPDTAYQQAIRSFLSTYSAAYGALTDAQRAAWVSYAQQNPITDSLGERQVLTGHAAYIGLNSRIAQAGESAITDPPIGNAPVGLLTLSHVVDIGLGGCSITFTATPLAADDMLYVQAAVVNSSGINYVKNLLKLVVITAKAQATGYDHEADLVARFGTLIVGQKVVIQCSVLDSATGLLSIPLRAETLVVST
jgi:hypothetical protein